MPPKRAAPKSASEMILKDNAPAYQGIRRALAARIGVEWNVGDRLPSISALAREMGVGQNTTQRAVHELVAQGVLFSRRRLGLFVRELPVNTTDEHYDVSLPLQGKTLGMVTVDVPLPFIRKMMEGFGRTVREAGGQVTSLIYPQSDTRVPDPTGHWGVVLFNPDARVKPPAPMRNISVVTTSDQINPELISRFDMVSVDQYQGGALAGAALRQSGCTTACFIGRQLTGNRKRYDLTSSTRLHGFEFAWAEHLKSSHLIFTSDYSKPAGKVAFEQYMNMTPKPEGVFAATDELAVGFATAAIAHNLKPGRDYHLIGFDGQDMSLPTPLTKLSLPTIRVPAAAMGSRAADLMIKRLLNPARPIQRVLLPCSVSIIKPS